jgi:hypothetical protein
MPDEMTGTLAQGDAGREREVAYLFLLFALILPLSAQQMLARRGETAGAAPTADTWGWAGALRLDASYHLL